jgi:hypothetical protein
VKSETDSERDRSRHMRQMEIKERKSAIEQERREKGKKEET